MSAPAPPPVTPFDILALQREQLAVIEEMTSRQLKEMMGMLQRMGILPNDEEEEVPDAGE